MKWFVRLASLTLVLGLSSLTPAQAGGGKCCPGSKKDTKKTECTKDGDKNCEKDQKKEDKKEDKKEKPST